MGTYTIGRIKRLGSTPKYELLQLANVGHQKTAIKSFCCPQTACKARKRVTMGLVNQILARIRCDR
jgi:hypothetical protein